MKQKKGKSLSERFRRITYSTSYLPEVDGLRFLAIFSVVVIMHITGYLNQKFYRDSFITDEYWQHIVIGGGGGVTLFFIISGFILALPFARWRLTGSTPVHLKKYYLRRLTRLEPPYIIVLILLFIAQVWVLGKFSFQELLPHFFASVFYVHMFIYHSFSWILPVAWSLEVEVQFYLVAPLLFLVFLVKSAVVRRIMLLAFIVPGLVYWHDNWSMPHLLKFLHYFFTGILLAEMYVSDFVLIRNERAGFIAGLAALAGFIFIPSIHDLAAYLIRFLCMFLLFHTVLTNQGMKKLFSYQPLVIIGGMCYTIYLLHFAIVSFAGRVLTASGLDISSPALFLPLVLFFSLVVLVVAAVFFLVAEKPFMKPWLKLRI